MELNSEHGKVQYGALLSEFLGVFPSAQGTRTFPKTTVVQSNRMEGHSRIKPITILPSGGYTGYNTMQLIDSQKLIPIK